MTYFEFILEFTKEYGKSLNEHVLKIFDAVVKRIIAEIPNKKKGKPIINKCWNVIKTVVKSNDYMP